MATMLVSSSPSAPRTPTTNRYLPAKSSPLTPTASSPTFTRQASASSSYYARQRTFETPTSERRRGQYKSYSSSVVQTPVAQQRRSVSASGLSRTLSNPFDMSISPAPNTPSSHSSTAMFLSPTSQPRLEDPQKMFLRERFKARCLARVQQEREKKLKEKRRYAASLSREPSSDGFDMMSDDVMADVEEVDEDEDEEEVMNDIFFQRIIASVNRKQKHHYKVSYDREVGSSFDPSFEEFEEETFEAPAPELTPNDLDEEELAAYAAEYELLEGLSADDVFSLSDVEDIDLCMSGGGQRIESDGDIEMG